MQIKNQNKTFYGTLGINKSKLPAKHDAVVVDWYVRSCFIIVRTKVTVRRSKPLMKAMLEREILFLLAKMPVKLKWKNNV